MVWNYYPYIFLLIEYYVFTQVRELNFDDYADVQEAMWEARCQWFNIGVRFKLNIHDLRTIRKDAGDVDDKFHKMLDAWFRNGENRTWAAICDVLQHNTVDMSYLADKVRMKFPKIFPTPAEGTCNEVDMYNLLVVQHIVD